MRIRLPFAGGFFLLSCIAGYAGLTSLQLDLYINDKALHLLTFFLLTVAFYWILDTNRRRTLNLTLVTCTLVLGVGSEFVQSFLPNGREFDIYDIVANVAGSLAALALCSWYHKRMLDRRRQRKNYDAVPGEDDQDVELGVGSQGSELGGQETGVVTLGGGDGSSSGAPPAVTSRTLEQEVDNWDENAVDNWDEDDNGDDGDIGASNGNGKGKALDTTADGASKKRAD